MYIVRSGDTLGEIAERYGTSVATLRRSNGLDSSAIRVGQRLTVPAGSARGGAATHTVLV